MREWGTLRAMGTKKRDILLLVLYEGCLQGLIGAIIGIAAGFAIAGLIDVTGGLTYRNGLQAFAIMVRPSTPSGSICFRQIVTAGLAALLPGLKAVRFVPSECLRAT